jgi:hypothetical protein
MYLPMTKNGDPRDVLENQMELIRTGTDKPVFESTSLISGFRSIRGRNYPSNWSGPAQPFVGRPDHARE